MQTFKELITELYGECTHISFKRLDRLTNQRSRLINNLAFLKRCRDNKVVPKGLRISNNHHTEYACKILKKAELALVRERIARTRKQLCRVDGSIANLTEDLWMTLNEEHYATAKRMTSASSTKTFDESTFHSDRQTHQINIQSSKELSQIRRRFGQSSTTTHRY